MKTTEVLNVIQKHMSEIEEKVVPAVTEKIIFSFTKGFECGLNIGYTVIRDETIGWLYLQLNKGLIEVRDMDKLMADYKDFIEAKKRKIKEESV